MLNAAVVIPCYRHGKSLGAVLKQLEPFGFPVYVTDDGNVKEEAGLIAAACAPFDNVTLLRNDLNGGKGAAVVTAAEQARKDGFNHLIQLDADGQHRIEDLPRLLALSEKNPGCVISVYPKYSDDAPKARLYGRKITNFWVAVETLSTALKDTMCGFRIYPAEAFFKVIDEGRIGMRMDFDIEILVRMYWNGVNTLYVESPVNYPLDGVSSFDAFHDNVKISLAHTRMFFESILHYPALIARKFKKPKSAEHWAEQEEVHGLLGMKIMMFLYRLGGRGLFNLILYPVIFCYYLSAGTARRSSKEFLQKVAKRRLELNLKPLENLSSYKHFYTFGQSMLEKLASWQGDIRLDHEVIYSEGSDEALNGDAKRGHLIIGSHLGDLETLRAVERFSKSMVINALVFTENARRFKAVMNEFAPKSNINLIPVQTIGPETAAILYDKIEKGEWVAILGDRVPVSRGRGGFRVSEVEFMGESACFPQGPYILASVLKCPVLVLHALHENRRIVIYCQKLSERITLERKKRDEQIRDYTQQYARILEKLVLDHPLDWFNFYDFFKLGKNGGTKD